MKLETKSFSTDEQNNRLLSIEYERDFPVYKENELVRMCYDLPNLDQKLMSFIISKINPMHPQAEYQISINDYLQVAGLHDASGKNYANIKKSIQNLANESIWVEIEEDGRKGEQLERFLDNVKIFKNSGIIKFQLGTYMTPFLTGLNHFVKYSLRYVLAFKGRYSIHLYEVLKSYQRQHKVEMPIENLKVLLLKGKNGMSANYSRPYDFLKRVIEPSLKEINLYSDIYVRTTYKKKGKKLDSIVFEISLKSSDELIRANVEISGEIDKYLNEDQIKGQMNITDYLDVEDENFGEKMVKEED